MKQLLEIKIKQSPKEDLFVSAVTYEDGTQQILVEYRDKETGEVNFAKQLFDIGTTIKKH